METAIVIIGIVLGCAFFLIASLDAKTIQEEFDLEESIIIGVTNMQDDKQREEEQNNSWLMMGDCLERMKEIPDSSVDMVSVLG